MNEEFEELLPRKSGRRSSCLFTYDTTMLELSVATSKYLEKYGSDNIYAYNYPKELITEFQQWIVHAKSFHANEATRVPQQLELSPYELLNKEQEMFFIEDEYYAVILESAKRLVHSTAVIKKNKVLRVQNAVQKMKILGEMQNKSVVNLLKR